MRGQRNRDGIEADHAGKSMAAAVIKVSEYQPRRCSKSRRSFARPPTFSVLGR